MAAIRRTARSSPMPVGGVQPGPGLLPTCGRNRMVALLSAGQSARRRGGQTRVEPGGVPRSRRPEGRRLLGTADPGDLRGSQSLAGGGADGDRRTAVGVRPATGVGVTDRSRPPRLDGVASTKRSHPFRIVTAVDAENLLEGLTDPQRAAVESRRRPSASRPGPGPARPGCWPGASPTGWPTARPTRTTSWPSPSPARPPASSPDGCSPSGSATGWRRAPSTAVAYAQLRQYWRDRGEPAPHPARQQGQAPRAPRPRPARGRRRSHRPARRRDRMGAGPAHRPGRLRVGVGGRRPAPSGLGGRARHRCSPAMRQRSAVAGSPTSTISSPAAPLPWKATPPSAQPSAGSGGTCSWTSSRT